VVYKRLWLKPFLMSTVIKTARCGRTEKRSSDG
jgi:hypothetical protein